MRNSTAADWQGHPHSLVTEGDAWPLYQHFATELSGGRLILSPTPSADRQGPHREISSSENGSGDANGDTDDEGDNADNGDD